VLAQDVAQRQRVRGVPGVHGGRCCHTMTLMSVASTIIDADSHPSEPRTMWADHVDPADRHLALRIGDDDLGHAWLMRGDRRIHIAEVHRSGNPPAMGRYRQRVLAGLPPEERYDDALPRDHWDP